MANPAAAPRADRPLFGVLWMLGSGLCFVGVTAVVRHLGTDLPAAQSAFLRFGWALVFLLPALIGILRRGLPVGAWPLVWARGAVHLCAVVLWFYAMARLPLAEVTAIGYLNPVLVTLGAALFFGERLALRRLIAIVVAILGALVVLRPGLRELAPGHLAQIGAAVCFAGSYLMVKRLGVILAPTVIVALMSLTVSLGLLPLALAVWVPVSWQQLAWLGLVAGFATLGHYCMTRALLAAPVAVTQPVTFLQLVWASLVGVLLFAEPVDPYVLLGGAIIMAAISYITWREAMLKRAGTTPPVNATKT